MRYGELISKAASALIWCRKTDQVLLLLRSDLVNDPLQWSLPGGHIEQGETVLSGLYRELQEEIGQNLSDSPIIKLSSNSTSEPQFIHTSFAICVYKPFEPRLNWEHVEYKWVELSELPEPLSWSVNMLLNNESAAKRLKLFQIKMRKAG